MKEFQIVSSKFPNGVTYLLNILLELGIKIWRDGPPAFWHQLPDGGWKIDPSQIELERHLPSLKFDSTYYFKNDVEVKWCHDWPNDDNYSIPTILVVRNGKDAIYSDFKRQNLDISFNEFLSSPLNSSADGFQFIHNKWNLPPPEIWALYNLVWMDICKKNGWVVIRFEDLKKDPLTEICKILSFLDLNYSNSEIERAIFLSSFERAYEEEKNYLHRNPEANNN